MKKYLAPNVEMIAFQSADCITFSRNEANYATQKDSFSFWDGFDFGE